MTLDLVGADLCVRPSVEADLRVRPRANFSLYEEFIFYNTALSGAGACTWTGVPPARAFSTSRAHRYRQVW
jgi:hypothetical protein